MALIYKHWLAPAWLYKVAATLLANTFSAVPYIWFHPNLLHSHPPLSLSDGGLTAQHTDLCIRPGTASRRLQSPFLYFDKSQNAE